MQTGRSLWIVAALGLAACGGGGDSAASGDSAAAPAAAPAVAAAPTGASVFGRTCVTCHQANGMGLPGAFPPLGNSPYVNGDKGRLIRLVLHGLTGPITVEGNDFNGAMPPWKSLSDAEMAAVLTYVRSNFGNASDAVTAEEVAAERTATAERMTMWTVAELGGAH